MIGVHWYRTKAGWDNVHSDSFGEETVDGGAPCKRLWAIQSDIGITSPLGVVMRTTTVSFDGTNLSWSSTATEDPDCSRKWPAACDWERGPLALMQPGHVVWCRRWMSCCALQGSASGSLSFRWRYPRIGVSFQQKMPQYSQMVPHQNKGQHFEISQEKKKYKILYLGLVEKIYSKYIP